MFFHSGTILAISLALTLGIHAALAPRASPTPGTCYICSGEDQLGNPLLGSKSISGQMACSYHLESCEYLTVCASPFLCPQFSHKLDCRRLGITQSALILIAQGGLHSSITCALRRIPPGVLSQLKGFRTTVPHSQQPNARMPMATSAITTLYVSQLSLSLF